jgi:hypothetical protein
MSTCFWGVKENVVYEESYSQVLKNIEKSKFNIEVEEVEGRYRLKTDISSFWFDLDDELEIEIYDTKRAMGLVLNKPFDVGMFINKPHYSWLDIRTNESDEEMVYGLTRYSGNDNYIAELVLKEVLNCSEVVNEYDEIERLVEVGIFDPSVLEDEDEEETV